MNLVNITESEAIKMLDQFNSLPFFKRLWFRLLHPFKKKGKVYRITLDGKSQGKTGDVIFLDIPDKA
jgi:hypothetical protein